MTVKAQQTTDVTVFYPIILQVFDVSSTVTILQSSGQNPKAFPANCVHY